MILPRTTDFLASLQRNNPYSISGRVSSITISVGIDGRLKPSGKRKLECIIEKSRELI